MIVDNIADPAENRIPPRLSALSVQVHLPRRPEDDVISFWWGGSQQTCAGSSVSVGKGDRTIDTLLQDLRKTAGFKRRRPYVVPMSPSDSCGAIRRSIFAASTDQAVIYAPCHLRRHHWATCPVWNGMGYPAKTVTPPYYTDRISDNNEGSVWWLTGDQAAALSAMMRGLTPVAVPVQIDTENYPLSGVSKTTPVTMATGFWHPLVLTGHMEAGKASEMTRKIAPLLGCDDPVLAGMRLARNEGMAEDDPRRTQIDALIRQHAPFKPNPEPVV